MQFILEQVICVMKLITADTLTLHFLSFLLSGGTKAVFQTLFC